MDIETLKGNFFLAATVLCWLASIYLLIGIFVTLGAIL